MPSSYSFTYRRLTGGKVVNRGKDLPGGSVDLIVTAMEDQVHFQAKSCRRKFYLFSSEDESVDELNKISVVAFSSTRFNRSRVQFSS